MMEVNGCVLKGIVMIRFKYYCVISFLFVSLILKSQVGVGLSVQKQNVILEFACEGANCVNDKGIILPIVGQIPNADDLLLPNANSPIQDAVNGTFLLDAVDARVKVFSNNSWINLSYQKGDVSEVLLESSSEDLGDGVLISDGDGNSAVKGVLVLESSTKALVLPKIEKPYEIVQNPYPGMMCYDTDSKSLMVFDGRFWNIWKEKKTN